MTNEELIATLEAAEGPSRTLMWAAFDEIHGIAGGNTDALRRFRELLDVAAWESAALMLVSDEWDIELHIGGGLSHCVLKNALGITVSSWNKNTPALAICIAALKAGGEG